MCVCVCVLSAVLGCGVPLFVCGFPLRSLQLFSVCVRVRMDVSACVCVCTSVLGRVHLVHATLLVDLSSPPSPHPSCIFRSR